MTPEDILHAEIPVADLQRLRRAIEGMPFNAHVLWSLSHHLAEQGDRLGAKMVEEWAEEFAVHEARRHRLARGRGGAIAPAPARPSARALNLATCSLPDFAAAALDASKTTRTGRWHGAVFISHVWGQLLSQGDPGITYDRFKRRLFEAYQAELLDLSRADLVEAMPHQDVHESELEHRGARFHFVRT